LDRLIDAGADIDSHGRALAGDRVSGLQAAARANGSAALRQAIQRDLSWLFNASNSAWTLPLAQYPELATSVVNFGVRSYAGLSGAAALEAHLEQSLTEAILAFEPRIIPATLRVQVLPDSPHLTYRNHIALVIHGELYRQATTEVIYLKTEFDLDSSEIRMTDISGPQSIEATGAARRSGQSSAHNEMVVHEIAPATSRAGGPR
jgi:type VI secretion system protein ImpF